VTAESIGAGLPRGAGVRGASLLAAVAAVCAGAILLAIDGGGFFAGLCVGLALALLVAAGWGEARDAEALTERELAKLAREGWTVEPDTTRDATGRRGHVVARHGRVFRLDSYAFDAVVSMDNFAAVGGAPAPALTANVRGATWSLRARFDADVRAVVVVWAEFPQAFASVDGIDVVCGDRLTDWLRSR
jgi:hypothetical protein